MHHVALAFAGRSDDPLSHDLVNNMRLAGVVQRLACRIEGIAHEFCNGVVKDARRNERKDRRHAKPPKRAQNPM